MCEYVCVCVWGGERGEGVCVSECVCMSLCVCACMCVCVCVNVCVYVREGGGRESVCLCVCVRLCVFIYSLPCSSTSQIHFLLFFSH